MQNTAAQPRSDGRNLTADRLKRASCRLFIAERQKSVAVSVVTPRRLLAYTGITETRTGLFAKSKDSEEAS